MPPRRRPSGGKVDMKADVGAFILEEVDYGGDVSGGGDQVSVARVLHGEGEVFLRAPGAVVVAEALDLSRKMGDDLGCILRGSAECPMWTGGTPRWAGICW
eukprot:GFKZ01005104.1.p1 GENE.GFKZ01005104.1~~GFKZ01005104.1.p1  ORF type:complete len:101 (-),score=8.17 GFKZ01005104.1:1020-1322(-)